MPRAACIHRLTRPKSARRCFRRPSSICKILLVSERDKPVIMYCYVDMAIYKNGKSDFCAAARNEINKTAIEFGFDPIRQEDERDLFECISEIFRQLSERRN